MTPFPPKTPMTMRREAYLHANPRPKPKPPGKIDPSDLPQLAFEAPLGLDAPIDWSAHVAAGRVEIK